MASRLLYYHNGADAPNDLWVYDPAERQSQQITHSLVAGVRSADMVEPYLVHYPSRDGKFTISALGLCAEQYPAQRKISRHRVHSRRPGLADL